MDNQKLIIGVVAVFAIALLTGSIDISNITGSQIAPRIDFPGWSYCSSSNPCGHGLGDCDSSPDMIGMDCQAV